MYINKYQEADFRNGTYKKVTNPARMANDPTKSGRSGSYASIGKKTWSEIIKLYKESRS